MKGFMFDTSIILANILKEDKEAIKNTDKLLAKSKGNPFILDFTKIEVSNILVRKFSDEDSIETVYQDFLRLEFNVIPMDEKILKLARLLSFHLSDTVYDTTYHAAAFLNDLVYVTLDKKYFQKAERTGSIMLLC